MTGAIHQTDRLFDVSLALCHPEFPLFAGVGGSELEVTLSDGHIEELNANMDTNNSNPNALIPTVVKNDTLGCNLRVIKDSHGEPWFVATDVAKALGYRDAANLTRRLDEDEISNTRSASINVAGIPNRGLILVSEAGLYEAIFNSERPEAKEFKRWVKREVLPSIRKHGGYIAGQSELTEDFAALVLAEAQERAKQAREYNRVRDNGTPSHVALGGPKAIQQYNDATIERIMQKFNMSLHMARLIVEGRALVKS